MLEQPTPEAQRAANEAMERSWRSIATRTARFLTHAQRDIHDKAWQAGYEFGTKREKQGG